MLQNNIGNFGYKRDESWWDIFFLRMAAYVATASKDPSTKVGCILADSSHKLLSMGYNGFPRGAEDDYRLNIREEKYKRVIHAEENAILNSHGDLSGSVAYLTHPPCLHCCGMLKQVGVSRVVFVEPKPEFDSRWNLADTVKYLKELDIEVASYRMIE